MHIALQPVELALEKEPIFTQSMHHTAGFGSTVLGNKIQELFHHFQVHYYF